MLLGLRDLHLANAPVIVHSSLKSFGNVEDGASMVVNALATVFATVIVPTFTYKTMIIPPVGPENNGITYGSEQDLNQMAEFFIPRMPCDPLMGIIPEIFRRDPRASRSSHPIQSFAGINSKKILLSQTRDYPLAPLGMLEQADGWVLLMGVDHTLRRETGGTQAVHPLGADSERRGGMFWFPGLFSGFPGYRTGDGEVHPQGADW
jgi:aminoglycoside 3-N-acetyltransferase